MFSISVKLMQMICAMEFVYYFAAITSLFYFITVVYLLCQLVECSMNVNVGN